MQSQVKQVNAAKAKEQLRDSSKEEEEGVIENSYCKKATFLDKSQLVSKYAYSTYSLLGG